MLDRTDHNRLHDARFGLGGNYPPEPIEDDLPHALEPHEVITPSIKINPIERARSTTADLSQWMKDNPVIQATNQATELKRLVDLTKVAFDEMEIERKKLVDPLNEEVNAINARYKPLHNTDAKRPGTLDKIVTEAKARGTAYLQALERERMRLAEEAAQVAAEAEKRAREAEDREREARENASLGEAGIDIAAITAEADAAFAECQRASRFADRAERDTKVKLTGGIGNSMGLRQHETLTVTDWKAAIEDIGLTTEIQEAIIKGARAYRSENHELPSGIASDIARRL